MRRQPPHSMLQPQPNNPGLVSRYECKYLVPRPMLEHLRAAVQPFVQPDPFAAKRPGHRYPISSLYLDSRDLRLFRMTDHGEKNRYKLRIRCYTDAPEQPLYFEIKKRLDGIVRKWRRGAPRDVAERFLTRGQLGEGMGEFLHLSREIDAGPTFRVRYDREAYQAIGGEPTRITFDTDLSYNLTVGDELSLNGSGWIQTMQDQAIVEIKFTDRFPTWVQDLVESHDLQRRSVPKYCLAVEDSLERGECDVPLLGHRALTFAF